MHTKHCSICGAEIPYTETIWIAPGSLEYLLVTKITSGPDEYKPSGQMENYRNYCAECWAQR